MYSVLPTTWGSRAWRTTGRSASPLLPSSQGMRISISHMLPPCHFHAITGPSKDGQKQTWAKINLSPLLSLFSYFLYQWETYLRHICRWTKKIINICVWSQEGKYWGQGRLTVKNIKIPFLKNNTSSTLWPWTHHIDQASLHWLLNARIIGYILPHPANFF